MDETITGMRMRQEMANTRARYAAQQAGCRGKEIHAFVTGATWALEEIKKNFNLDPKDKNLAEVLMATLK